MKINSCLFLALLLLLVSYTLAAQTSQTDQKAGDGYKVESENYGGGGNHGGGGGNHGGGGGGGGGWKCNHGCCYSGWGGRCQRCCSSPEEAKAFAEKQGAHP